METASVKQEKGYKTDLVLGREGAGRKGGLWEEDGHRKKTFFTVCFLNIDLEKQTNKQKTPVTT